MPQEIETVMTKRQSIREFDPKVKISRDEMTAMLKMAITAPSACNLQAWKFIVVDTPAGKEKLRHYFMPFNFPQVDTSAAVVLFFGNKLAYKKYRKLWQGMYKAKKVTKEAMEAALNTFMPLYEHASEAMLKTDATIDTSLAAMQFMLIAQAHGYDTNAIAGYDASKAAESVGLDPEQFVPVMAVAIGKSAKAPVAMRTSRYDIGESVDYQ